MLLDMLCSEDQYMHFICKDSCSSEVKRAGRGLRLGLRLEDLVLFGVKQVV